MDSNHVLIDFSEVIQPLESIDIDYIKLVSLSLDATGKE
jgi:hypothetical protein